MLSGLNKRAEKTLYCSENNKTILSGSVVLEGVISFRSNAEQSLHLSSSGKPRESGPLDYPPLPPSGSESWVPPARFGGFAHQTHQGLAEKWLLSTG